MRPERIGVHWVVFDYGEVISRPTAALPQLAGTLGVSPADLLPAYWAERDRYDRGCGDAVYWQAVGERLGVPVDDDLAGALARADIAGWLHADPGTLALLVELSAAEVPLALLSNAASSFGRAAERQPWAGLFRHLVFSGDLGIAKPDPEIWGRLLDRLQAQPQDCLFLDDKKVNVEGARTAGLYAEQWTNPGHVRARLAEFGVLPASR
jgi:putative hydrolase of the HAD superfamily